MRKNTSSPSPGIHAIDVRRPVGDPDPAGRKSVKCVVVVVKCHAQLFQIILALGPAGGFPCLLHGGKQERNQNRDDRNHDQQFNQRERTS